MSAVTVSSLPDEVVLRRSLEEFKKRLLDLSNRNLLFNLNPKRVLTLESQDAPDSKRVVEAFLRGRGGLIFHLREAEGNMVPVSVNTRYSLPKLYASYQGRSLVTNYIHRLHKRSRTLLMEQGINTLFMTLGTLEWQDLGNNRIISPIILVPVRLERKILEDKMSLFIQEEGIEFNPVLLYALHSYYNLNLENWAADIDEEDIWGWLDRLREEIHQHSAQWSLQASVHIGIFNFQKLVMYRDFERYENIFLQHPIIHTLLAPSPSIQNGISNHDSSVPQGRSIDLLPASHIVSVLDADSSQLEAILAAHHGQSFVLQGPPGTGKSQTIVNMIADFIAAGKTVLFVSEKVAALEVVYHRLQQVGLAEPCLELHSSKINRRDIVRDLASMLSQDGESGDQKYLLTQLKQLETERDALNEYVSLLHKGMSRLDLTPYQVYGLLAHLRGVPDIAFDFPDIWDITQEELDALKIKVSAFAEAWAEARPLDQNPWRRLQPERASIRFQQDIYRSVEILQTCKEILEQQGHALQAWGIRPPQTLSEFVVLGNVLAQCRPSLFKRPVMEWIRVLESFHAPWWWGVRAIHPKTRHIRHEVRSLLKSPNKLGWRQLDLLLHSASELHAPEIPQPGEIADHLDEERLIAHSEQVQWAISLLHEVFAPEEFEIWGGRLSDLPLETIYLWAQRLLDSYNLLEGWLRFLEARRDLEEIGLKTLVQEIIHKDLNPEQILPAFEKRLLSLWLERAYQEHPSLQTARRTTLDGHVQKFRRLDKLQLDISRTRVRLGVSRRRPQHTDKIRAASSPVTLLRREATKKRRHKPLTILFREISDLLPMLKPCVLANPLAVSKYFPADIFSFDLVLFDEASQVPPQDALPVIVRGKQLVVVGDRHQLPPTTFFQALVESSDGDEDDEAEAAGSYESILDLCSTVLQERMLQWHYRSRHESLIQFSNYHFYDNMLSVFPTALRDTESLGIRLVHVPDGIYDRGKSRTNPREAERVVDLTLEHFRRFGNTYSLGVVALSQAQEDAVAKALEARLRKERDLLPFFTSEGEEPFFIKNLETVQGDERDVIILCIGYGPDHTGKMTMNFGPLNREGGARRLNVAITRARRQLFLVTSFLPDRIDPSRTRHRGIKLLRWYLEYAQSGGDIHMLEGNEPADVPNFDSPFEKAVYDFLCERGWTVHTQVGCAGYRIDLALVDPEHPGRYLLGIECDGVTYHSSRTARDRDRLRQEILEKLGWTIHRIWSRDWVENPEREYERILAAVERVRKDQNEKKEIERIQQLQIQYRMQISQQQSGEKRAQVHASAHEQPERRIRDNSPSSLELNINSVAPRSIDEVPNNAIIRAAIAVVEAAVRINQDELVKEVSRALGYKRLGHKIRARIEAVLEESISQGYLSRDHQDMVRLGKKER